MSAINHNDTIAHHIQAPERHVDAPRSDWQTKLQEHQASVERNDQMTRLVAKQKMLMESRAKTKTGSEWNKELTAEIQRVGSRIKALRAQVAP